MNERAEPLVADVEHIAEPSIPEFRMSDRQSPRSQPARQSHAPPENLQEVAVTAEHQRSGVNVDREGHADTVTDIFLETGRAGETLGRMDDLGKSASARIETRPDLATLRHVLRHGHDAWNMRVGAYRQRTPDEASGLCPP